MTVTNTARRSQLQLPQAAFMAAVSALVAGTVSQWLLPPTRFSVQAMPVATSVTV